MIKRRCRFRKRKLSEWGQLCIGGRKACTRPVLVEAGCGQSKTYYTDAPAGAFRPFPDLLHQGRGSSLILSLQLEALFLRVQKSD